MPNRRSFLKTTTIATAFSTLGCNSNNQGKTNVKTDYPKIISTWKHEEDNQAALNAIINGGSALDAIEMGIRMAENNESDLSVGVGGLPDRDGNITLDACIMDSMGKAGSVSFLQGVRHPISLARKVMENTPHVMLTGVGAQQYARELGFPIEDLSTPESNKKYQTWKKDGNYKPVINIENHDTIGMLSIDKNGNLAGGCSTSGLAYKMHGRVGDSPIIGAGLFVDNEVGAATATGMGELVLRTLGSFLVVELMRQGATPAEACKNAVIRIVQKGNYQDLQVGYVAMDKQGNTGAFSLVPGFIYTETTSSNSVIRDADSYLD